jgi:TupA-like ATPgrasp
VGINRAIMDIVYRLPAGLSRRVLFMYFNRQVPRFSQPATFNEKVNWRILNDRRQLLEFSCDKLAMKDYARSIPRVLVPPVLWFGDNVHDLENVELPEHWVLKPNHRSGVVYFGHGLPGIPSLNAITREWSRSAQSEDYHEWAYSKARRLLLVEELLGQPGACPTDYKFFVFAGEVAAVQVDVDRHTAHQRRIYLPDWSPLDVSSGNHPLAPVQAAPVNLDEMISIARAIGQPFDFMRVDLYSIDGATVFGEMTPYAGSGLDRFIPRRFDIELGKRWELPRVDVSSSGVGAGPLV